MSENNATKSRRTVRNRYWWAEQVEACEKSGMSMVAYAKANSLNLSSFYNWKTALRRSRNKQAMQTFNKARAMQFVEVLVNEPKLEAIVEISSPGGWNVRVPWNLDTETTLRFVSVIEGRG